MMKWRILKMADFTISVKTIVEMYSQFDQDFINFSVDQLISNALPNIFDFNFPFYDESKKEEWERRFIKHFYMYEIGLETIGLWKLMMENKFNEIMPFYNKLYTEFKNIENMTNNLNIDETGTRNNTGTSTANSEQKSQGNNQSLFSDTPQSRISIGQHDYVTTITEATIGDNTNANSTQNVNNTESYSNNRKGNIGNRTNAELFKVASESIVNIDQMIYNECSDLFMLLY